MLQGGGESSHAGDDTSDVVKNGLNPTAAVRNRFALQRLKHLLDIALLNARFDAAAPFEVSVREKKKFPRTEISAADRRDKPINILFVHTFYARKRSYPVKIRARRELSAENFAPYQGTHFIYHTQPQAYPSWRTAQLHGDLRYAHAVTGMQSVHDRSVLKFRQPLVTRVAQQGKQPIPLITLNRQNRNHMDGESSGAPISLKPVQQQAVVGSRQNHHQRLFDPLGADGLQQHLLGIAVALSKMG